MILVDYADLLRPDRQQGEKRHELEETYDHCEPWLKFMKYQFGQPRRLIEVVLMPKS